MNTVSVEVPFILKDDGSISFLSVDLLKMAEEQVKHRTVECEECGKFFYRIRGNPKYCQQCRGNNAR
jgi:formylmethanofuran dehydrogenase subunit E